MPALMASASARILAWCTLSARLRAVELRVHARDALLELAERQLERAPLDAEVLTQIAAGAQPVGDAVVEQHAPALVGQVLAADAPAAAQSPTARAPVFRPRAAAWPTPGRSCGSSTIARQVLAAILERLFALLGRQADRSCRARRSACPCVRRRMRCSRNARSDCLSTCAPSSRKSTASARGM